MSVYSSGASFTTLSITEAKYISFSYLVLFFFLTPPETSSLARPVFRLTLFRRDPLTPKTQARQRAYAALSRMGESRAFMHNSSQKQ